MMNVLREKHIVTIGAGTGQRALLEALKARCENFTSLTAIVGITDTGGHSGELRMKHNIPAVGDARQCLVALARNATKAQEYEQRDPQGRSFGNARLALFFQETNSTTAAFLRAAEELDCCGLVLPTTDTITDIRAFFSDGSAVTGEFEILEHDGMGDIKDIELVPKATASPNVLEALQRATHIVIAPGGIYNGIIPALLPDGIREVVTVSSAKLIHVINLMTDRLTPNWDAATFIREITPYLGRTPDVAIVNNGKIPEFILERYRSDGNVPVQLPHEVLGVPTFRAANLIPDEFLHTGERPGEFKKSTHLLVHDPEKLLATIEQEIA